MSNTRNRLIFKMNLTLYFDELARQISDYVQVNYRLMKLINLRHLHNTLCCTLINENNFIKLANKRMPLLKTCYKGQDISNC